MLTHVKEKVSNPWMVLGNDLDGTSGDFHSSFRDVLISHQGHSPDIFPANVPKEYCYVEAGLFADRTTFLTALHSATGQGVYRNMKPYKGLRECITDLYNSGAEIKIITSRPDDAMEDTILWLEEIAQIPYHSVTITSNKIQVPATLYIDDMPAHIQKFQQAGRRSFIFDQPYNRRIVGERVNSWDQIAYALGVNSS